MRAGSSLQILDHRLDGVPFNESPNQDERPDPEDIALILIHAISLPPAVFGGPGVLQLFTNTLSPLEHPYYETIHTLRVSAHLFVNREGHIIQFVDFNRRAWHAGISSWKGRENLNDCSIGIELEGTDQEPFEAVQYQRLNEILDCLIDHYARLNLQTIAGHQDVAPDRKWDPGPYFDWKRIGVSRN